MSPKQSKPQRPPSKVTKTPSRATSDTSKKKTPPSRPVTAESATPAAAPKAPNTPHEVPLGESGSGTPPATVRAADINGQMRDHARALEADGLTGVRMEMIALSDLVADPENRRKHNDRNISMIAESLDTVGPARSIVIDEANVVQAGNGVVQAATRKGYTKVLTVEADDDTLVAVRKRGLTASEKRHLALSDNRAAELAEWNPEQLRIDMLQGLEMKPFFTDAQLEAVTRVAGRGTGSAESAIGDLEFRVVVDCQDEGQQADLIARLEQEGLKCRALIS
jgi:hypothetical protein